VIHDDDVAPDLAPDLDEDLDDEGPPEIEAELEVEDPDLARYQAETDRLRVLVDLLHRPRTGSPTGSPS
jgi:hypothetical protein